MDLRIRLLHLTVVQLRVLTITVDWNNGVCITILTAKPLSPICDLSYRQGSIISNPVIFGLSRLGFNTIQRLRPAIVLLSVSANVHTYQHTHINIRASSVDHLSSTSIDQIVSQKEIYQRWLHVTVAFARAGTWIPTVQLHSIDPNERQGC